MPCKPSMSITFRKHCCNVATMGKRKHGVKYEHNHTYNAAARESEDRKMNRLRGMEVKRLRNNVEKQIQNMQRYIPPEKRKKQRIGMLISSC